MNGQRIKRGLALLLALCCLPLLGGCSKDALLQAYDRALTALGSLALTDADQLRGTRTPGPDGFAGRYQAAYTDFSGKEVIFGGTTLKRRAGGSVAIRCDMAIDGGQARLMCKTGADAPQVLCESSSRYRGELDIPAASSYIWVEGEDWTGSIDLTVE